MTTIDQQKLEDLHGRLFGEISAGYGGVMCALGDKLGLYKAMAHAGPLTAAVPRPAGALLNGAARRPFTRSG